MGFFEDQRGLPPGDYSPTFLELDAQSGPWLKQKQADSPAVRWPQWEVDIDAAMIRFGSDDRFEVAARFEVVGTHAEDDGTWLWAWSNPKLAPASQEVTRVRDENPDVPELQEPTFTCTETKAWALAAAAAWAMKAESCFRLPGKIATFVALFDVADLASDDPRARRPRQDPAEAQAALAAYAGPMSLNVGGLLLDTLRHADTVEVDEVIAAIHAMCDNLEALSESPVGAGTPAAEEAVNVASVLRRGILALSVPRESPAFHEAATEMLAMLKDLAVHFGAWSTSESSESGADTEPA